MQAYLPNPPFSYQLALCESEDCTN
ncbi:hypothetical protein [Nostoc sp. C117]